MIEHLFVYGTLVPGRQNEHILKNIGGTFQKAYIFGNLIQEGWGASMGCPALKINVNGTKIDGYIFSSKNLSSNWTELDDFEGSEYLRVLSKVTLENGSFIDAYIYTLKK